MENEIARKCFASLVLDVEYPGDEDIPAYVKCRVLVDGWYRATIYAANREEAISRFYSGEWKEREE